ncbi:hypothetical protein Poli38472_007226 [Pythium oligandrum]|uniref:Uncharacterized protein n=1 Tax=Pythium oligandrum TaxID=41045 RepID=A0A8K1C9Y0_PYTOL|nr:hypothetical protein Poli38472_007226 [Pythium oligandrum]|eukprot:TMW59081.1 hypothetical protein Poli38472_007226 [Pythium oligandrum]
MRAVAVVMTLLALTSSVSCTAIPTEVVEPLSIARAERTVDTTPAAATPAKSAATPAPAPSSASLREAHEITTTVPTTAAPPRSAMLQPATSSSATSSVASTSGSASGSKDATAKPTKKTSSVKTKGSDSQDGSTDGDDTGSGAELDPSLINACVCRELRMVSLMGAANYCLARGVSVGDKCGNTALAEKGACPRKGAQPCQDTGHVLTKNSQCVYDKRDDTYKCVASKEDLLLHKKGKRFKKKKNGTSSSLDPSAGGVDSTTSSGVVLVPRDDLVRVLTLVASLVLGVAALT